MSNTLRTLLSGAFAIALFLFASAGNDAQAQFIVGGGLAFGTDIESAGVQAGGVYALNDDRGLRLAADFIFFFPGEDAPGFDVNVFEINLNGHYIFYSEDAVMAYALGGLSIATVSVDVDLGIPGVPSSSVSDTELGINAGAGIEYDLGFGYLYGEAKLVLGGFDQFVISGGIRVPVGGN